MMQRVEIKTVGSSGQISLGKQYAGRTVTVEQVEEGVWVIKSSRVVPENELWLHQPDVSRKLDSAIQWAEQHPPRRSNLAKMQRKLKESR